MEYFKNFSSNTYAATGNQLYFEMNGDEVRTGRVFYKITSGGKYNYSILFSNIIDSTYDDGTVSYKNLVCDEWQTHSALRKRKAQGKLCTEDIQTKKDVQF